MASIGVVLYRRSRAWQREGEPPKPLPSMSFGRR